MNPSLALVEQNVAEANYHLGVHQDARSRAGFLFFCTAASVVAWPIYGAIMGADSDSHVTAGVLLSIFIGNVVFWHMRARRAFRELCYRCLSLQRAGFCLYARSGGSRGCIAVATGSEATSVNSLDFNRINTPRELDAQLDLWHRAKFGQKSASTDDVG